MLDDCIYIVSLILYVLSEHFHQILRCTKHTISDGSNPKIMNLKLSKQQCIPKNLSLSCKTSSPLKQPKKRNTSAHFIILSKNAYYNYIRQLYTTTTYSTTPNEVTLKSKHTKIIPNRSFSLNPIKKPKLQIFEHGLTQH